MKRQGKRGRSKSPVRGDGGRSRSKSPIWDATAGGGRGGGNQRDNSNNKSNDLPPCKGYLISCDVPTKQFIQYLNELKPQDKKFILQDLDSTHLLVKMQAKDEIEKKVDDWMDENVFSSVERVGEDLDMS